MSRTKKGITLIELVLALAIVLLIAMIAVPAIRQIQSRKQLLREVRTQHPEAVLVVKVTRDAASHYVVTVRNTDNSVSTYTLDKK
ncbi:MAG: prepilin-type N-terminal cleavage/methylation domain-containing protein [Patescibacteria group bacterium]